MPGSRRTPGGRPSGGRPSGGRPSGGRSSAGAGATRRSTGPSSRPSRSDGRVRTSARPRTGVDAGAAAPEPTGGGSGGGDRRGTGPGGKGRGRGRPSVTSRAAVLALIVAVLLVSYAYPLRTWWDQHSQTQQLENEADRLAQEQARLERELELWEDPAFVAAQARERLGFVMPGEQGYVVVPAEDDAADAETVEGLPPAGDGEWYERLWSSVEAADTVPATDPASGDGAATGRTTRGGTVDPGPADTEPGTDSGTDPGAEPGAEPDDTGGAGR